MDNLESKETPYDLAAEEATKLLRVAHVAQMRGDVKTAEDRVRQALQIKPDDAEAYAVLGEMLLARSDAPGALEQFKRAKELRPDVDRYEAGYAKATLAVAEIERRKAMAVNAAALGSTPVAPRNPMLATMASLVIPGAGQAYNGQWAKAALFLLVWLATVGLYVGLGGLQVVKFFRSDFAPQYEAANNPDNPGVTGIKLNVKDAVSPASIVFGIVNLFVWVACFIDAGVVASRANKEAAMKTGWEV